LILAGGQYAGFILVRDVADSGAAQVTHHVAEFFVLRKYRRMKVGQRAAWAVFDRFPGRWHVAEMEENTPAQAFWRATIADYTRGAYREVRLEEWEGPVQLFETPSGGQ
jgi:predicted acetyltransferase